MRKTVFVSSTYQDLSTHRKAIWGLLEEFDVAVRGMEEFGARTETPLETCLIEVEQSDIYVGVVGFRLGSVEERSGKSYTQLEYEKAQELKKETLVYLIDEENARVPVKYIDRDTNREKLEAFKRTLRDRHTVDTFVTEDDLVQRLRRDLGRHLQSRKSKSQNTDEFSLAADTLRKFLLLPKLIAGREVRLGLKITGNPYPASREICSAFNYEFGATVGIPVEISRPDGFADSGLSEIYLIAKQAEEFLPVAKGDEREVYAKLQFSEDRVEKVRTRFKHETTYTGRASALWASTLGQLGEAVHHQAEAKIILALTKPIIETPDDKSVA